MEYQALIQPVISIILAIISGLLSYVASKANNKAEIEKQAVDFDRALKIANKASNNKQNLKKRFIQKTSKKS